MGGTRGRLRGGVWWLAGGAVWMLGLGGGAGDLAAQDDCGERASLRISVRDDSGVIPIPGATVVLRWTETDVVRRPVRREALGDGELVLCAPPDARQATVWAEVADASSEEAVVAFDGGAEREVELRVQFGSASTGRLLGSVRDAGTGDPVASAAVSVAGRAEVSQTNRRGRFILSGVPAGEHELTIRHLGYAPLTHQVSVTRGITTEVDVGLVPDPVAMEPLVATVERLRRLEVGGFYERRYWGELVGGGLFFTATDVERRMPSMISHMIADAPGIFVGNCGLRHNDCQLLNSRVTTRMAGEGCLLSVFVDGTRITPDPVTGAVYVDRWVKPIEIAGVEVYSGAVSLPAEYAGSDSQCGVVVIWTK